MQISNGLIEQQNRAKGRLVYSCVNVPLILIEHLRYNKFQLLKIKVETCVQKIVLLDKLFQITKVTSIIIKAAQKYCFISFKVPFQSPIGGCCIPFQQTPTSIMCNDGQFPLVAFMLLISATILAIDQNLLERPLFPCFQTQSQLFGDHPFISK